MTSFFVDCNCVSKITGKLCDAELGRLFRAMLAYASQQVTETLPGREDVCFPFMQEMIDGQREVVDENINANEKEVTQCTDKCVSENVDADEKQTEVQEVQETKIPKLDAAEVKKPEGLVYLTCIDGTKVPLGEHFVSVKQQCYPNLDVLRELKNFALETEVNPNWRVKMFGYNCSVTNWLNAVEKRRLQAEEDAKCDVVIGKYNPVTNDIWKGVKGGIVQWE